MFSQFSRQFAVSSIKSIKTQSVRSYSVIASCKQPYDTSSSVFDAPNEVERSAAQAKYEQNILGLAYVLQPFQINDRLRATLDDEVCRRVKERI